MAGGEPFTVTRDGRFVAELRPLQRGPSAAALIERFRRLPPVDPKGFRHVGGAIDQAL